MNPAGRRQAELMVESESQLLERVRRGAPEALGALYARHGDALYALICRVTGSPDEAEDVVHDLFLGLPELLRRYEDRGQLRAWLRRVAVRLAQAGRRRTRRRASLLAATPEAQPHQPGSHPLDRLDLARALAALPDAQRVVFVLKQVEGYSHDDIADMLGISTGASRTRHLRALRRLRQLLEPGS